MSSLLTNLENNEAVLLMYLANELPAEDREEVESMLIHDEHLRVQLDTIRQAYGLLDRVIGNADSTVRLPSGFSAARAVGDAVRKKNQAVASLDDHEDDRRHISRWWYPAAAAALLALGMFLWWQTATQNEVENYSNNDGESQWHPDFAEQPYVSVFDYPSQDPRQRALQRELEVVNYLRANESFW